MNLKFTLLFILLIGFISFSTEVSAQMPAEMDDFQLKITTGGDVDSFKVYSATFGPAKCDIGTVTGELKLIEDLSGGTTACDGIITNLTNNIALIDRGDCAFTDKVGFAQQQGAIAVIICNNVDQFNINLGGEDPSINIPSFRARLLDCDEIKLKLDQGVMGEITINVIEDEYPNETVLFSEDFTGGLNSFITLGIESQLADVPVDEVVFSWSDIGRSSLLFTMGDIYSPTACDGAAIFDLQAITTREGTIDPPASSGSIMTGELISPVFDASSASAVTLKFWQVNIPLNGDNAVAYSTDGGSTWSDPILIPTDNVLTATTENVVGTEYVRVPMPELAGATDARIKFIGSQDFYFWMIDDVMVVSQEGADARLFNAFDTPLMYGTPRDHADADVYVFSASVENLGGQALENGVMTVEIKNADTDEVVHTETLNLPTIEIGTRDTFRVNAVDYFPTALDIGTYAYTYNIDFPGSGEIDFSNNSQTYFFEITADTFTKEDGNINNSIRLASDQGWTIGSIYLTSPNFTDPIVLNKITTSIQSDSARLDNNYFRIVVAKQTGEFGFAGGFDVDSPDPSNHPDFDPPIVDEFILFDTQMSEEPFDIPISTKDNEILLEPGVPYVVFAMFDEAQPNGAAMPNNLLRLGANTILPNRSDYIIFNDDERSWFSGFSDFDFSPHLRMTVNMVASGVDDNPLPDHVFTLSPNPASDFVLAHINFDQPTNMNLLLADIEGRIISMKDYNAVTKMEERMNVAELSNGLYLMRVSTLEGTKTVKFVVQH